MKPTKGVLFQPENPISLRRNAVLANDLGMYSLRDYYLRKAGLVISDILIPELPASYEDKEELPIPEVLRS